MALKTRSGFGWVIRRFLIDFGQFTILSANLSIFWRRGESRLDLIAEKDGPVFDAMNLR